MVQKNRESSGENSVQETAAREEFIVAADLRIDNEWNQIGDCR